MRSTNPGRQAQQKRSRARVQVILDVALELLIEGGSEALAMREVARRAGVPVSSVYQYFPSKTAVIRELAIRNSDRKRDLLEREVKLLFAEHDGTPTVAQVVDRIVDAYVAYYSDQKAAVAVWAGGQGDCGLRELDTRHVLRMAEVLTPAITKILPLPASYGAFPLALQFVDVTGAAARLAVAVEKPLREQIVGYHKLMLVAAIEVHR